MLAPQAVQPNGRHSQSVGPQTEPGEGSELTGRAGGEAAVRVEIYVAKHCQVCEYAYEIAENIAEEFPAVDLRMIDLFQTTESIPDAVFATPTYLLNGRLWSLGNPSQEEIKTRLSSVGQKPGPDARRNSNEG